LQSLVKLQQEFYDSTGITLDIDLRNHSAAVQSVLEGALARIYQYDIVFVPHKELGRLVQTGSVFSLDTFARNAGLRDPKFQPDSQFFQPFFREVSSYQGTWYALPLYLGGSVVVYRRDLIENPRERARFRSRFPGQTLGEPKTFNEWARLARFYHRPTASPPLNGIVLLLSEEALWYEWQSVLFAFGGNVLDASHGDEYGDIIVNSPAAVAATEAYRNLARYAQPDAPTYSWGLGISNLQAGKSFMGLMQYDVVAAFDDSSKTRLAGKFGYFLPRTPSGGCASQLESWVGFIPTSARSPEAAWLVLQWMMSARVQLRMHRDGNVSPRRSTWDDSAVVAHPASSAIIESLSCMVPKPTIPEADAIQQVITRRLQSYFSGVQPSAKVALDSAAIEIEARLQGKAKLRYSVSQ